LLIILIIGFTTVNTGDFDGCDGCVGGNDGSDGVAFASVDGGNGTGGFVCASGAGDFDSCDGCIGSNDGSDGGAFTILDGAGKVLTPGGITGLYCKALGGEVLVAIEEVWLKSITSASTESRK